MKLLRLFTLLASAILLSACHKGSSDSNRDAASPEFLGDLAEQTKAILFVQGMSSVTIIGWEFVDGTSCDANIDVSSAVVTITNSHRHALDPEIIGGCNSLNGAYPYSVNQTTITICKDTCASSS